MATCQLSGHDPGGLGLTDVSSLSVMFQWHFTECFMTQSGPLSLAPSPVNESSRSCFSGASGENTELEPGDGRISTCTCTAPRMGAPYTSIGIKHVPPWRPCSLCRCTENPPIFCQPTRGKQDGLDKSHFTEQKGNAGVCLAWASCHTGTREGGKKPSSC